MDKGKRSAPSDRAPEDSLPRRPNGELEDDSTLEPNPPRTTKDGMTAPKFGSAGSGGAELEPGPERD